MAICGNGCRLENGLNVGKRWGDTLIEERQRSARAKKSGPRPTYTGSENDLQIFCADWCRARGLYFNHTANELSDVTMLGKLKKKGLAPGFPDLCIFTVSPRFPRVRGVAYEIKTATGKVKPAQRDWLTRLAACGWWTGVIRSPDEFMLEMERLGWG